MGIEIGPFYARSESALWTHLKEAETPQEVLAAATVIVANDPDDPRWQSAAPEVAEQLVLVPPDEAEPWMDNVRGLARSLTSPLEEIFSRLAQQDSDDTQRTYVTALALQKFCREDRAHLARLLIDLRAPCARVPLPADSLAGRPACLARSGTGAGQRAGRSRPRRCRLRR